jgi:hypothetical protein
MSRECVLEHADNAEPMRELHVAERQLDKLDWKVAAGHEKPDHLPRPDRREGPRAGRCGMSTTNAERRDRGIQGAARRGRPARAGGRGRCASR